MPIVLVDFDLSKTIKGTNSDGDEVPVSGGVDCTSWTETPTLASDTYTVRKCTTANGDTGCSNCTECTGPTGPDPQVVIDPNDPSKVSIVVNNFPDGKYFDIKRNTNYEWLVCANKGYGVEDETGNQIGVDYVTVFTINFLLSKSDEPKLEPVIVEKLSNNTISDALIP